PGHPDFISQVAGIAGTGNVDRHTGDLAARDPEILEIGDVGLRHGFEQLRGGRALQCERGDFLGNVFDLHVHVQAVLAEPAQAGIGRRPAVDVLLQTRNGAVVDDLAVFIAPAAVNDLADFDLVDIAGNHAVYQAGRIPSGDHVLVERRN